MRFENLIDMFCHSKSMTYLGIRDTVGAGLMVGLLEG